MRADTFYLILLISQCSKKKKKNLDDITYIIQYKTIFRSGTLNLKKLKFGIYLK